MWSFHRCLAILKPIPMGDCAALAELAAVAAVSVHRSSRSEAELCGLEAAGGERANDHL